MVDPKEDLGISLNEIENVQEVVWDAIKRGGELLEIVNMLEQSVKENPKMLKAILSNYFIFSDMILHMSPEEYAKMKDDTSKRRG